MCTFNCLLSILYVCKRSKQRKYVFRTFGYTVDDNERLVDDISSPEFPDNFPLPSTGEICARDTVCPCKIRTIACCQCRKCANRECRKLKIVKNARLTVSPIFLVGNFLKQIRYLL